MTKNIKIFSGDLELRVDRRTELLGIIQRISKYNEKYPHLLEKYGNKEYVEEIEKRFNKYKTHPLINLFNDIVFNLNFSYDAPVQLFLELNDDFTFDSLMDYPFKTRLKSDKRVIEFLKLLKDFSKEINFDEFYNDNKDRYLKYLNNVKQSLGDIDLINSINEYYNIDNQFKFVVNLIPWQTGGNYGTWQHNEIHANICTAFHSKTDDDVYSDKNEHIDYANLLHHEFSHKFINPLTDKYNIIKDDATIFNDIKDLMNKMAYSSNYPIINEHIIRALTIRWEYLKDRDDELYKDRVAREIEKGFIHIENILESLVSYEKSRDKYHNLDIYYPIIINNLIKSIDKHKKSSF